VSGGDRAVMALAARQHGLVTTADPAAARIGPRGIAKRVAEARLRRLRRGVFLVGPLPGPHMHEMAAVLACGHGAVVSHHAAAGLGHLPGLARADRYHRRRPAATPGCRYPRPSCPHAGAGRHAQARGRSADRTGADAAGSRVDRERAGTRPRARGGAGTATSDDLPRAAPTHACSATRSTCCGPTSG
jgi:hypothetical protein